MLARQSGRSCPVCGWIHQDSVSEVSRYCNCCGIERGVQDRSLEQVKSWRNKWLMSGGRWCGPARIAEEPPVVVPKTASTRRA